MALGSRPNGKRVEDARVRRWNDRAERRGDYVVYWMQALRRAVDNPALEHAIAEANRLRLPIVVYESLRPDYPHASDRLHRFVLEHARDTARALRERRIPHGFFLPRDAGSARGIAAKVFARAALVVSDENPSFIFPRQNARAAAAAPCAYVTVDDCCVVPLSFIERHEVAARTIRPKIHALAERFLVEVDPIDPVARPIELDWPFTPLDVERADFDAEVARCEIDHHVPPVRDRVGGSRAAYERLSDFVKTSGPRYDEGRNFAPAELTSGLSPYLHFGAISPRKVAMVAKQALSGEARDAFLEQLLVRRALAFNHAARDSNHASYAGVPEWARSTLADHARDARPEATSLRRLERAESDDALWNAAQRELVVRGRMHNVVRMYWGKRLLQLVESPERAFAFGCEMFDKYALDGRDPNTYTGVGWCFGLHDQPFPERPIFGRVRPMGQGALKKRFSLGDYVSSVPARIG